MLPNTRDPAKYRRKVIDGPDRLIGAYEDDTIGTGSPQLEEDSKGTAEKFYSSKIEYYILTFYGIQAEKRQVTSYYTSADMLTSCNHWKIAVHMKI